jgi:hypothetical protein
MLNHQEADRVPITESLWVSTVQRWREEGLPEDISPAEFFDYEIVSFGPDQSPQYPTRTISEDDFYVVESTPYGGIVRNRKDYASVPEVLDFPCKTRKDWENMKDRLVPSRDRVDWKGEWPRAFALDHRRQAIQITARVDQRKGLPGFRKARAEGKFIAYVVHVGYGHLHQSYMTTEELLVAVAKEPEWVIDMYETTADLAIGMYDIMVDGGRATWDTITDRFSRRATLSNSFIRPSRD